MKVTFVGQLAHDGLGIYGYGWLGVRVSGKVGAGPL